MIVVPNIWAQLRDLVNNDVWSLAKAGAPTNGTSGDGAGFAGPGSSLADVTNKKTYLNTGTKASPTWTLNSSASSGVVLTALAVNSAISPSVSGKYVITKGSAEADTLAAPAASPGGDGIVITITSDSAFAHTITFTGSTLDSGSAAALTATFNPNKGASLTIISYNGRWKVDSANGVSFS